MRKLLLLLIFTGLSSLSYAQLNEVGFFLGGSNYVGDIGSTAFIRPNAPAFGLIYKYNTNPRIAYRATFTHMQISPDDSESLNEVRAYFQNSFDKNITEITAGIEFNFFEYNIANDRMKSTPYFILEVGGFQYDAATSIQTILPQRVELNYATKRGIAIPFGIGFKGRLYNKLAFAIETRFRYTFKDDLDDSLFIKRFILPKTGSDDIVKFNNPDTNDWYMFTGVSLVYTFGRPPCYSKR